MFNMFNIKSFNSCIWQAWLRFSNHINVKGVPFPMIRDPKTGKGSITATLVIASSGVCFLSILLMLGVFIARINSWFILNEETLGSLKTAFHSSFEMFLASLAAYLGRKWQGDRPFQQNAAPVQPESPHSSNFPPK